MFSLTFIIAILAGIFILVLIGAAIWFVVDLISSKRNKDEHHDEFRG